MSTRNLLIVLILSACVASSLSQETASGSLIHNEPCSACKVAYILLTSVINDKSELADILCLAVESHVSKKECLRNHKTLIDPLFNMLSKPQKMCRKICAGKHK